MKWLRVGIIVCALFFLFLSNAFASSTQQHLTRLDGTKISTQEVEQTVKHLMAEAKVTGLNLAVLNNNKITYIKSFGFRNKEEQLPLTENTAMYGASFTKAVFSYMVMQLVAEGILDLDKPVYQYLPKPLPEYEQYKDLANDERYKLITIRMCLSHTAGFPNFRWINPDKKLDIKFTPGSRYAYSGEGINLVQFIIENAAHQSLGDLMRERIFKPFNMNRTSMTWLPEFNSDLALGYDEDEQPLGHKQQSKVNAAGSMDTTIRDYAKFIEAVMQNNGVPPKTKNMMVTSQIQIYSPRQFPTLLTETTDANRAIKLGYGLGWGVFETPHSTAYFKEGHDDGWENHSVVFPDKKIAIVLMANSSNADKIYKALLEKVIGDKYTPWQWEGYIPYEKAAM
jgi:CubicO group peptidase (beta-lactamase class C family)